MSLINDSLTKTVGEYDAQHDALLIKSVDIYGKPQAVREIDKFLGKRSAKEFPFLNRHARHAFRTNLQMRVAQVWPRLKKDEVALGLFTFIDRNWVTNEAAYKVNLVGIKQKVRNALGGANFIAVIEHVVYSNKSVEINGKSAKMVSVHVHAVVGTLVNVSSTGVGHALRSGLRPSLIPTKERSTAPNSSA
jgi:hypothetical protein